MKTTSFEISKELKELGFEAETIFYINLETEESQIWLDLPKYPLKEFVKSYDLETILDALPVVINGIRLQMNFAKGIRIGYSKLDCDDDEFYIAYKINGESLADTAARLLIKLIKDKEFSYEK